MLKRCKSKEILLEKTSGHTTNGNTSTRNDEECKIKYQFLLGWTARYINASTIKRKQTFAISYKIYQIVRLYTRQCAKKFFTATTNNTETAVRLAKYKNQSRIERIENTNFFKLMIDYFFSYRRNIVLDRNTQHDKFTFFNNI